MDKSDDAGHGPAVDRETTRKAQMRITRPMPQPRIDHTGHYDDGFVQLRGPVY